MNLFNQNRFGMVTFADGIARSSNRRVNGRILGLGTESGRSITPQGFGSLAECCSACCVGLVQTQGPFFSKETQLRLEEVDHVYACEGGGRMANRGA